MAPPSSFASAAASGSNANSPKPETNEWTRRTNGATQTFRRPAGSSSSINTSTVQQSDPPAAVPRPTGGDPPVGVYIPPFRNGMTSEHRYSKEQLLSVFRAEQEAGNLSMNLSAVYVHGWEPNGANGASATSPWTRQEQKDQHVGVDVCWDKGGLNAPLGLTPLSTEEQEIFNSSVNSPIKPPVQLATKDVTPRDGSRKLSVSANQNSPGGFNLASPTSRPGNRRRDTNEAYPFPSQAGSGRFSRDEVANPPASLMRRRTEYKDAQEKDEEETEKPKPESGNPAGLKRSTTGGIGSNGSWGASPPTGFSPMGGAFGNFALSPSSNEKRSGYGSLRGGSRFKSLMKDSEEDPGGIREKSSSSNLPGAFAEDDPNAGEETPSHRDLFAGLGSTTDDALLGNMAQQTPHRQEPMSPTNTNPYQSPEEDKNDKSDLDLTGLHGPLPGLGGFGDSDSLNLLGLGPKPGFGYAAEQSQMPAAGPLSGLGALPGLGASSAWTPGMTASDTSARDKPFGGAFGDNLLSSIEGQPAFSGPSMMGGMSRGSRLASLLPNAMDVGQFGGDAFDPFERGRPDISNPLFSAGFIGSMPLRESDSPLRPRGLMEEMAAEGVPAHSHSTPSNITAPLADPGAIGPQRTASGGQRPGSTNNLSFQLSAPQVRQMVMPDRMKWEYKDHHGHTQGPFSGLEMHDWYKAGYFTPELLIKKLEDPEYEPLAQLIRRIGNSREPFLVPQIGVPHSPPPNQRPWAGSNAGGIQPPFANSFPSFGTTLTAEQQNDLERRKQEAQYLMARQKEHLQQHQFIMTKMQQLHPQPHGSFPQQLHHQNSAHSLSSQPSIGSMTGPGANFPNSQISGPGPSVNPMMPPLDPAFRGTQPASINAEVLGNLRDEKVLGMMNQMNLVRGPNAQGPLGSAQPLDNMSPQVAAMLSDRSRLQREQVEADAQQQMLLDDPTAQLTADRLMQFHELRAEDEQMTPTQQLDLQLQSEEVGTLEQLDDFSPQQSMTQQVQMAVSQKAAWPRVDPATMQQIVPPPQSISPMPAPVAQRRQNVADTLATASRSANQTPSVETPSSSVAPWAKEAVEAPKGPSLREIQEAEARKAAQREELAAAARRVALEKEVLAVQQASGQQPQPGLPSSSTWGSSTGNVLPAAPGSVWGARTSTAARPVAPNLPAKKTLQQIQKEEEARKLRAAAVNSVAPAGAAPMNQSSGKRYADLAGKAAIGGPAQAPPNFAGGAWTTVGAGGKIKTPVPANTSTVPTRSISGSVTTVSQAASRPKQATRSTTLGGSQLGQIGNKSAAADAMDEFRRWAVKELGSHLNKGINAEGFVDNLLAIGLFEPEVITEAVHGASQTIDSRHFAEEFVRRHKLASAGVPAVPVIPSAAKPIAPGATVAASGGWNEVAKKGPGSTQQQENLGSFKVVAGKKKGKR